MNHFTRPQAKLLAVLLDANGAVVPYPVLGDTVESFGVDDKAVIRQYVHRLRALGVDCVEVVRGRGCRLTAVPPDWTLDDVLRELDALREGWAVPALVWRRSA